VKKKKKKKHKLQTIKNKIMKTLLKTALLFALAAIITPSCSKNYTIETIYHLGITSYSCTYSGPPPGACIGLLPKIENYFESLQIPETVTFIGKGKSEEEAYKDADAQAKSATLNYFERIKEVDVAAIESISYASFRWVVARGNVYIHEFKWNIEE
jgi:hypothetical protein